MTRKDQEARREQAYRRLHTRTPKCATCGNDRWQCLQAHHIAGKDHHDIIVPVCANCHCRLSDAQRDHPPKQPCTDPWMESLGRLLLGLVDMLAIVLEALREFGLEVIARACTPANDQSEA